MRAQALEIASWGPNVYVKIPVTTTTGASMAALVADLSASGVQVNVTALMTERQVETVAGALRGGAPSCVSVFAGRIADTGRDPLPDHVRRAAHPAGRPGGRAHLGQPAGGARTSSRPTPSAATSSP